MSFNNKRNAPLLAGLLLGCMVAPVWASDWVTVAAACVPDEESTGKYALEFAHLQFIGSNTGEVAARCNISSPLDGPLQTNPSWNLMEVTYSDPDGASNGSQVLVTLRRVDKLTGASTNIKSLDSNAFPSGQQLRTVSFTHTFDFVNNGYYLALIVRRTSSSLAPRVSRARLFISPPQ